MTRECHVRFCERPGVRLPGSTRPHELHRTCHPRLALNLDVSLCQSVTPLNLNSAAHKSRLCMSTSTNGSFFRAWFVYVKNQVFFVAANNFLISSLLKTWRDRFWPISAPKRSVSSVR